MKKFFSLATLLVISLILSVSCNSQSNIPVGVYELPANESFDFKTAPGHLVIIDFNASWCGPCRSFAPVFAEAAKKYQGKVQFVSIDIDKHEKMARELMIQSIPAVLFIYPSGQKDWHIGFMNSAEFQSEIDKALAPKQN